MPPRLIVVNAARDEDAGVWFVESSDLPGLHVEAPTLDSLVEIVVDVAPDLVAANLPDALEGFRLRVQHIVEPAAAR
jgi:hypothetical protein